MNEQEYLIFAELKRDHFDDILGVLLKRFSSVQFGRQGDDWIWIHLDDEKIEIDSFFSMQLQVKAKRRQSAAVQNLLSFMEPDWVLQVFDPPSVDLTR